MSQDSTQKDGAETAQLARGERGRFAPGGPGGPGRPKRGQTLAEQWRRGTDWEALRARLEQIALNPKAKDADAIAAVRELADRAWGKPLSAHELHVTTGASDATERDWSKLPIEERRALLAKMRAVPRLGAGEENPA